MKVYNWYVSSGSDDRRENHNDILIRNVDIWRCWNPPYFNWMLHLQLTTIMQQSIWKGVSYLFLIRPEMFLWSIDWNPLQYPILSQMNPVFFKIYLDAVFISMPRSWCGLFLQIFRLVLSQLDEVFDRGQLRLWIQQSRLLGFYDDGSRIKERNSGKWSICVSELQPVLCPPLKSETNFLAHTTKHRRSQFYLLWTLWFSERTQDITDTELCGSIM